MSRGRQGVEDERRRILEMVEQGRLSAQEANELLAALDEPEERPSARPGECDWGSHCGPGGWRCVGKTMGGVVGKVVRSLFRGLERRRRSGEG